MASAGKVPGRWVGRRARGSHPFASLVIVALGRFGYAAEGLVHILIGALAVQVAFGHGGETTDYRGVLLRLAEGPFGRVLLIEVVAGFVGYAIWRFLQAVLDLEGKGHDAKGIVARLGFANTGALHLAFAVSAVRLLGTGNAGATTDATAKGTTAQLLGKPFGQWLVALIGLVILGMAGYQLHRAITAGFRDDANLGGVSRIEVRVYTILGRIGHTARGVVFATIGLFFLNAAWRVEPEEARGLDTALAALVAHSFGPWLLGAVASGFIAYGLFLVAEARFHHLEAS
jgi:hypothetical protein